MGNENQHGGIISIAMFKHGAMIMKITRKWRQMK